jgi:hypothetical protein
MPIQSTNIHRFPLQEWDVNFRQMNELYADFDALGLATLGSSRIRAYRNAFQWLESIRGKDKEHFKLANAERVLHTMVEFHQLRTIVAAARSSKDDATWRAQLERLISGLPFPKDASEQSAARDFQFESYIGAVCELSGYRVRFEEPDVLVQDGARLFGLAAKRPRNPRKAEANCRKAVRQIGRSGHPGLVALDLSSALYPNKCINTNDLRSATAFVEAATRRFADANLRWLSAVCRSNNSFGALLTIHLPVINFGHPRAPQLATATRWDVVILCNSDDPRFQWGFDFARRCELGLFGPRSSTEMSDDEEVPDPRSTTI